MSLCRRKLMILDAVNEKLLLCNVVSLNLGVMSLTDLCESSKNLKTLAGELLFKILKASVDKR